jgi:hypothetical protein
MRGLDTKFPHPPFIKFPSDITSFLNSLTQTLSCFTMRNRMTSRDPHTHKTNSTNSVALSPQANYTD